MRNRPTPPTPTPPPKLVAACPLCDIEIVDETGTVISGTKQTKRVGEKIQITVRGKGGCAPSGISWTIPGTVVKDYQDNATTATVTPLPASDKTNATIKFYWVDGADGRSVSMSCTCAGAGTKTASVTYDVKAPTLDKFTSVTDSVGFDSAAHPTRLQFGLGGKVGIKWDWKVTVPAGVDGWVKDVQTINTDTRRTSGGTKQVWTLPGSKVPPATQLDTANPYTQTDIFPIGFPIKVTAGASYADTDTSDSPATPLGGTTRKVISDTFRYRIMYKPDTPDAIWVPVAVADWFWKGTATMAGGTWTLSGADNPANPSGSATTSFPEYTSNLTSNGWQNE